MMLPWRRTEKLALVQLLTAALEASYMSGLFLL